MTDHKQQQLSEHDVEGLLQQFFAAETPVEYRSNEPLLVTPSFTEVVAPLPTSPKESRQLAGYMALAISTICCLLVVSLSPHQKDEQVVDPLSSSSNESTSPTNKTRDFVPVEDRDHLSFSKLGGTEDPTASQPNSVDTLVPELEVEIFPLQPDKPK
ncbi:hypothetical protein OAK47_00820 [Planctomycetaceae bacterium]|jgi:hypothetical protein|nr:hypothetical protein [Planctomycetaceae bacterium]MDC0261740.1 hypothetical protein [Planctomycetaceae bacterium]MDC0274388.1 hypothetical protein [Planctomycetaceae bacterium]MDC0307842.1 hypothetical protein [Planctomycetaceae bacterium]MDG2389508.1 hypothetical protein [Planctomycetaceae bacterium]